MFGVMLKTTLKSWTVWAGTNEAEHKYNLLKIGKLIEKRNRGKHD